MLSFSFHKVLMVLPACVMILGPTYRAEVFEEGKVYTYSYEGNMSTGILDADIQQFAGTGFKATLIVYNHNGTVVFKLNNTQRADFNHKILNDDDKIHVNYDGVKADPFWEKIKVLLEEPFIVRFDRYNIESTSFRINRTDKATMHMRMAIASLFQGDFRLCYDHRRTKSWIHETEEDGIGGLCKTTYHLGHDLPRGELRVFKNRRFDQCQKRPQFFYSSLAGRPCQQTEFALYRAESQANYQLKRHGNYHIEGQTSVTVDKVVASGSIAFSPFGSNGQTVLSLVNQTLKLLKIKRSREPLPDLTEYRSRTSLAFVMSHEERDPRNFSSLDDLKYAHYFDRYIEGIRPQRVLEAERDIPNSRDDEHKQLEDAQNLMRDFYAFDYDDFVDFFENNIDFTSRHQNHKRLITTGLLPFIGTNPAILYLLHLTETNTIDSFVSSNLIPSIPFHVKEPSAQLLHAFWKYLHSKLVVAQEQLFTTSWLAFGSLIDRGCTKDVFNPHSVDMEPYVDPETCSDYVKKMIFSFNGEPVPQRKLLILRAIKNTRYEAAFNFLLSIIKGDYRPIFRREAIFALGPYGDVPTKSVSQQTFIRKTIFETIEAVFRDSSEDYTLRTVAFLVLVKSKELPESSVIKYMKMERNKHVAVFMYSTLEALVNSTDPCNRIFGTLYQNVLASFPPVREDILKQGINSYHGYFDEKFNFGYSSQYWLTGSNRTASPLALYGKESFNLLGHNFDFLELGLYLNYPDFIDKYVKRFLATPTMEMNFYDFQSWTHMRNADEMYKSGGQDECEFHFAQFNQDIMANYIFQGREVKGRAAPMSPFTQEEKYEGQDQYVKLTLTQMILHYHEVEYAVPNELGIPIVLSSILPTKLTSDSFAKTYIKSGSFELKAALGYSFGLMTTLSSQSPLSRHGFRLKTFGNIVLPIHVKRENDKENFSLKTSRPYDIFTFHTTPETFNSNEVLVIRASPPIQGSYQFGHDYFGVGATANYTFDPYWMHDSIQEYRSIFDHSSMKLDQDWMEQFERSKAILPFFLLNPNAKQLSYTVRVQKHLKNPSTEFVFAMERTMDENELYGAITVTANGPIERQWHFDFTKSSTVENKTLDVKIHFKRGPIPNYDADEFEMCLDFDKIVEKHSPVYLEPLQRKSYPKLLFSSQLTFGKSCKIDDCVKFTFKGVGEQSQQQAAVFEENFAQYRDKCVPPAQLEDIEYCLRATAEDGELKMFTVDVEYSNFPKRPQDNTLFYEWLHRMLHHHLETGQLEDDPLQTRKLTLDGELSLVATWSSHEPLFDVAVTLQNKTKHYRNIAVPEAFSHFSVSDNKIGRGRKGVLNYQKPTCYFSEDHFNTFDGVQYKYSLNDKDYYVVMTDCPNQMFAFRIRSSVKGGMELMINVGVVRITLAPLARLVTLGDAAGRIGKKWQEKCNATLCTIRRRTGEVVVSVERTDDSGGYFIKSGALMVDMFFNGKIGVITTSDFYKGSQCGLCGNFDGEKVDEFVGPNRTIYKSAKDFVRSYTVEDSTPPSWRTFT